MRTFIAEDIPGVTAGGVPLSDKQATDRLNRTLKCSHELGVKIGATVMLVQVSVFITVCEHANMIRILLA